MSDSLRSLMMSHVRELLISLTKKEWMSESPIFLSESLVRSFLDKKQKIRSEMKWANSQPWVEDEEESLQGITPVVTWGKQYDKSTRESRNPWVKCFTPIFLLRTLDQNLFMNRLKRFSKNVSYSRRHVHCPRIFHLLLLSLAHPIILYTYVMLPDCFFCY